MKFCPLKFTSLEIPQDTIERPVPKSVAQNRPESEEGRTCSTFGRFCDQIGTICDTQLSEALEKPFKTRSETLKLSHEHGNRSPVHTSRSAT